MMFRTLTLALAASFPMLGSTMAQAPATPQAATPAATAVPEPLLRLGRELVEASGIGRMFDSVIPDIALRIRQSLASRPEIGKDMDDTLVALVPEIRTRRGEMVERAARTMGSIFTEAEMRDYLTFFNSPSGKKYVISNTEVLNQVLANMDPWMQQTSEFFLNRFREEMRKKGHTL